MQKDPFAKFCGVLISFHEVMKMQSFEFSVKGVVIPKTFHPHVFVEYFC